MNTIYSFTAQGENGRTLFTASVHTSGSKRDAEILFKQMLTPTERDDCYNISCEWNVLNRNPANCDHGVLCVVHESRTKWFETCFECGTRMPRITPVPEVQPDPTPNSHPASWSLVIADMAARDIEGVGKYKTRLQPHNGRDTLLDAYQEALDLAVYLRTALYERDGK